MNYFFQYFGILLGFKLQKTTRSNRAIVGRTLDSSNRTVTQKILVNE